MAINKAQQQNDLDMDLNLVELWLRRDPVRWMAGILGGFVAGIVALFVAMIMAKSAGMDFWFPAKLMATPVLGNSATDSAMNMGNVLVGFLVFEFICVFWGFVYAHFTQTNSRNALLAMGLVWSAFSWIFVFNLFLPSFMSIRAAAITPGAAVPICLAYGLSLSVVGIIDRVLRGGNPPQATRN